MHAVVDVPVDHEPAPRLRIAEHRVVAERQDTPVDFNFLQRLDALEIIPEPHALRPGMVVVSQDQMLSPGEGLQEFHRSSRTASISSSEPNGRWQSRMMLKCPKCWSDVKYVMQVSPLSFARDCLHINVRHGAFITRRLQRRFSHRIMTVTPRTGKSDSAGMGSPSPPATRSSPGAPWHAHPNKRNQQRAHVCSSFHSLLAFIGISFGPPNVPRECCI